MDKFLNKLSVDNLKITSKLIIIIGVVLSLSLLANYFIRNQEYLYEEKGVYISEIYKQVDSSFETFINQSWNNLIYWDRFIKNNNEESIIDYINERKSQWNFDTFFFINKNGEYITLNGLNGNLPLDSNINELFKDKENIMINGVKLNDVYYNIFAVPVDQGSFRGFEYNAIGMDFQSKKLADSLNTKTFKDNSICLMVNNDGEILFSTKNREELNSNIFNYLINNSNINEKTLEDVLSKLNTTESVCLVSDINNELSYIVFQQTEYDDCILVGIVPEFVSIDNFSNVKYLLLFTLLSISILTLLIIIIYYTIRQNIKQRNSNYEIEYRNMLFKAITNVVDDIYIMIDCNNMNIDYITPNIERILHLSISNLKDDIGLINNGVLGEDLIKELQNLDLNSRKTIEYEFSNSLSKDKKWYQVTMYKVIVENKDKYIVIMVDKTRDHNIMENLETTLRLAEDANKAKSSFLSNMSHDIRTPMNAILGFLDLALYNINDKEKASNYLYKVKDSCKYLLNLINDILDMSKIESGKTNLNLKNTNLKQNLDTSIRMVESQCKAKNQLFNFYVDESIGNVICDELRLNQIVINLLSNAVKYTQENGNINLNVNKIKEDNKYVYIKISVKDNGMGMSKEFSEKIFESFTRETRSNINKIQGTGLGMAITKNLVDIMGGSIEVITEENVGTEFIIELKFEKADFIPEEIDASSNELESNYVDTILSDKAILVAEDNELSAEMLKERLEIEGVAKVKRVCNGEEIVKEFKHNQNKYDFILMDIQMPNMNGYEATKAIREFNKDIVIIAMTADVFDDDVKSSKEAGMNAHIPKPVEIDLLKIRLNELL